MPFIAQLPPTLEDGAALIKRREKAAKRKELWRSLYRDGYRFAMPMREIFDFETPGAYKNNLLYDSTLQEATYTAANTMAALLFPNWQRWAKLGPGGEIPKKDITKEMLEQLQEITEIFFDFLNQSNFATVSNEAALDLQIGTSALRFDEGATDDNPFVFSATPLAAIELEEGPNGSVETVFMLRKPLARNLSRMFEGMEDFDLPAGLQETIAQKPDEEVEIIQGTVFEPDLKNYYGVVILVDSKSIIWRFDYGASSPDIVSRASKIAGEIYGRGRVLLALSDARTLDKMQEFILRHAAQQIAPPMTGVSDGVLNPYTAVLAPNTILPVGSNDTRNPSLRVMEFGGNFSISEAIMEKLRDRVRQTMLGPEPSEGPVKSATEHMILDRNRLWSLGGEYGRIQVEFLAKVVARGIFILQSRGLVPKFKLDGRVVKINFISPFARSQDSEDLLALQRTMEILAPLQGAIEMGLDIDMITEWVSKKAGLDQRLVSDEQERKKKKKEAAEAVAALGAVAQQTGGIPGMGGGGQ